MFSEKTYQDRRRTLAGRLDGGIILMPGNGESPMNYAANPYPFRQDSSFLYYWGLDFPGLAAVIDLDAGREILFGDDFTVDDIIWMGPQKTLAGQARAVGVAETEPLSALKPVIQKALKGDRPVHILPPYRAETRLRIAEWTGWQPESQDDRVSVTLVRAVADQRNVKTEEELAEIEKALIISYKMNALAMKITQPGMIEQEVYGQVEGLVLSQGSRVSFPVIFSIHGETLHNHHHHNIMKNGDLLVLDSGAESPRHYASDITRTFPVNGKFTPLQKDVYQIVLRAQEAAIAAIKPDVPFRDVHLLAARTMAQGLIDLGFMKGSADQAVEAGAHALFFPHGLGHMMGLDVHDMENLGENHVGYEPDQKRSDQFGLAYLRMARPLEPGFVVTVEPGLYFIPELIDLWKGEKRHADFIRYDQVEKHRDFGGIRIEDDVVVTGTGHRILGEPIAKTIEQVEAWCAA